MFHLIVTIIIFVLYGHNNFVIDYLFLHLIRSPLSGSFFSNIFLEKKCQLDFCNWQEDSCILEYGNLINIALSQIYVMSILVIISATFQSSNYPVSLTTWVSRLEDLIPLEK